MQRTSGALRRATNRSNASSNPRSIRSAGTPKPATAAEERELRTLENRMLASMKALHQFCERTDGKFDESTDEGSHSALYRQLKYTRKNNPGFNKLLKEIEEQAIADHLPVDGDEDIDVGFSTRRSSQDQARRSFTARPATRPTPDYGFQAGRDRMAYQGLPNGGRRPVQRQPGQNFQRPAMRPAARQTMFAPHPNAQPRRPSSHNMGVIVEGEGGWEDDEEDMDDDDLYVSGDDRLGGGNRMRGGQRYGGRYQVG